MPRIMLTLGRPVGQDHAIAILEQAGIEVRFERCTLTTSAAELSALLQGSVAALAGGEPYTAAVFEGAPQLRHVARLGVGFDAVDVAAATAHDVLVSTTPGTLDAAVAELAIALMLDLARRVSQHDRLMRAGLWQPVIGVDLWQKTLGLVGLGRIGRAVVQRARGFEMRLVAYEPYPDREFVRAQGIELLSFEEVLRQSDVVSLHLPLSAETAGIVDASRLALMKPSAFLINTARGGLINEDALEAALRAKQIAGAGLDVRAIEPQINNRFAQFENVVLTPHIASNTTEARQAMWQVAAENIVAVVRGERPRGLINPQAWDAAMSRAR